MSTIVVYEDAVHIPDGIRTLAAFRRWMRSDEFPEIGRIGYFRGDVWVDMSKEQIFTHNQVKQEFKSRVFDRMFRLTCQPDETGNAEYSLSVR